MRGRVGAGLGGMRYGFAVAVLALAWAWVARAEAAHAFEGVWIWDKARYVPPPGIGALTHMTEETMSVSRDDGVRYAGQIRQVFDDGQVVTLDEDLAEDGRDQRVGTVEPPLMVRVSALADGGRRVVSGQGGDVHDSECHVSEGGRTMTCTGTHTAADGSSGGYVCVYHRDPHVIPVAVGAFAGARE